MTKYVKLRKCKLSQDDPCSPPPDSGDHPPPITRASPHGGGGGGGGDTHKARRLVEAMHKVIMNREQRRWRKVGGDGFSDDFEKVDGGKQQGPS